jgi:hypothetical protein
LRLVLIFVLCGAAAAQSGSGAVAWSRIVWESDSVTIAGRPVERAALMVEMRLDGMSGPMLMQLDTGTPASILLGKSYEQLRRSDRVVALAGRKLGGWVAGQRFDNEVFVVLPNLGEPRRLGSLGAMFFEQRVLIIDFVSQRIAILDPRQDLPAKFDFVPLDYRDHKIFVALTLNGSAESDIIFDTGSSALPLFTTARRWQVWTGRRTDDPRNLVLKGKSWGKEVTLAGAPLKGSLCLGKACLSDPLIFFAPTVLANLDLERARYRISGILGNALFDGRFTAVVDLPHRRFGLMAGSAAYPAAR